MIETTGEAGVSFMKARLEATRALYRDAVHPIYCADKNGRPTLLGTCFGLELSDRRYLITAAHVADDIVTRSGHLGDVNGSIVPLLGEFCCSAAPENDRKKDFYDFAWLKLDSQQLELLGWKRFIQADEICKNRAAVDGRLYAVLGFPRSKNKTANPATRQAKNKSFAYASTGRAAEAFYEALSLSGNDHITIGHHAQSIVSDTGEIVSSIGVPGMSGSPVLDMGRPDLSSLGEDNPRPGLLAGILIEQHVRKKTGESPLLAVKIDPLISAIRGSD